MACSKAYRKNPMITRQDAIKDLSHGDYCCYCTEPKTSGSCCGENHFVPFEDLYDDDKEAMIEEYLTKGN
jgi:hypothetical protein